MNANANKYLIDGFEMIGITDKNIATEMVKIGIKIGTRYGRGTFGIVLRKINTHDIAEPYVTHSRNEANSMRALTSPMTTNRNVMKP